MISKRPATFCSTFPFDESFSRYKVRMTFSLDTQAGQLQMLTADVYEFTKQKM